MSDFEDRLRAELRTEPAAPDTAFVASIDERIEASGKRRAVGLALASIAAAVLVGAMAIGLATLAPVWAPIFPPGVTIIPDQTFPLLGVVAPMIVVLAIAALLAPFVQSRR